ncbi:MAG: ribosome silencing factor [Spirochaetota bacterium]
MTGKSKKTESKLVVDPEVLSLMKGCKKVLDDKKAIDIVFLDLREVNSYLDYFLICTGNSILHCKALAREVYKYFLDMGKKERSRTTTNSPWIILDYNDLIIHIFTKETREFYQLERLWADARQIELD